MMTEHPTSRFGAGQARQGLSSAQMTRLIVSGAMGIVSVSAGVVLYLIGGLSPLEAILSGGVMFISLLFFNQPAPRAASHIQEDLSPRLAPLSNAIADLAQRVGEIGVRVSSCEQLLEKERETRDALHTEVVEISGILEALADEVSAQEGRLVGLEQRPFSVMVPTPAPQPQPQPAIYQPSAPPSQPLVAVREPVTSRPQPASKPVPAPAAFPSSSAPSGRSPVQENAALTQEVQDAIRSNRIELFLQPVVTLPQRKTAWYEISASLRDANDELIEVQSVLPHLTSPSLAEEIDTFVIYRAIQLVRRLQARNKGVGLFCNLSEAAIVSPDFIPQLAEFLSDSPEMAKVLILEMSQQCWRALGPIEHEALALLIGKGYRLSLDQLTDMRFDPRELSEGGIRFVKITAEILLRFGLEKSDIHPADLNRLMARYGIEMIVEQIETEGTVVDILDFDIHYGQGTAFAPPRPVRPEALRTLPEPVRPPAPLPEKQAAPATKTGAPKPPRRASGMSALATVAVRRA